MIQWKQNSRLFIGNIERGRRGWSIYDICASFSSTFLCRIKYSQLITYSYYIDEGTSIRLPRPKLITKHYIIYIHLTCTQVQHAIYCRIDCLNRIAWVVSLRDYKSYIGAIRNKVNRKNPLQIYKYKNYSNIIIQIYSYIIIIIHNFVLALKR